MVKSTDTLVKRLTSNDVMIFPATDLPGR